MSRWSDHECGGGHEPVPAEAETEPRPSSGREPIAPSTCSVKRATNFNPESVGLRKSRSDGNPMPSSATSSTTSVPAERSVTSTWPLAMPGNACSSELETSSSTINPQEIAVSTPRGTSSRNDRKHDVVRIHA